MVRLAALILLTAGLFGCDYASKSAAKATLEGGEVVSVAPAVLRGAVELRYVENDDIAFNVLRRFGLPRSPKLLVALSSLGLAGMVLTLALARRRRGEPRDARPRHGLEGTDARAVGPGAAGCRPAASSGVGAGADAAAGGSRRAAGSVPDVASRLGDGAGAGVAAGGAADAASHGDAGGAGSVVAADVVGRVHSRHGAGRPALSGVSLTGGALVLGGALGNFVDRIGRGYVIDFIHVHGWPVFNVADIAVVVGMGLIALAHLRKPPGQAVAPS